MLDGPDRTIIILNELKRAPWTFPFLRLHGPWARCLAGRGRLGSNGACIYQPAWPL